MKCIVGLGNPDTAHQNQRHNLGFMVLDALAKEWNISFTSKQFSTVYGKGTIRESSVFLVKPLLYMNRSGEALQPFLHFFKLSASDLIVISDDLSLAFGDLRVRKQGSHGGHNGLRSLIHVLQTDEFTRVRVGIGIPHEHMDVSHYVLSDFSADEKHLLSPILEKAQKLVSDLCV